MTIIAGDPFAIVNTHLPIEYDIGRLLAVALHTVVGVSRPRVNGNKNDYTGKNEDFAHDTPLQDSETSLEKHLLFAHFTLQCHAPRVNTEPSFATHPTSPGENILYRRPDNRNFMILDPDSGDESPLLANEDFGWTFSPTISHDGERVAVDCNRPGEDLVAEDFVQTNR
jgi:hypothetical protein